MGLSNVCEKETGQCPCKPYITGNNYTESIFSIPDCLDLIKIRYLYNLSIENKDCSSSLLLTASKKFM